MVYIHGLCPVRNHSKVAKTKGTQNTQHHQCGKKAKNNTKKREHEKMWNDKHKYENTKRRQPRQDIQNMKKNKNVNR